MPEGVLLWDIQAYNDGGVGHGGGGVTLHLVRHLQPVFDHIDALGAVVYLAQDLLVMRIAISVDVGLSGTILRARLRHGMQGVIERRGGSNCTVDGGLVLLVA